MFVGDIMSENYKNSKKMISNNPKSRHDYFLDEYFECGIELVGTEVKALRSGKCSIKEAWVRIMDGEVWIYQMHISPYEKGNIFNRDPLRPRKLLMHKSEILKIEQKIKEKGYTLVPTRIYLKDGKAKLELALAKGKDLYDKREASKLRDAKREMEKALKLR